MDELFSSITAFGRLMAMEKKKNRKRANSLRF
jgi:hypothetical protein